MSIDTEGVPACVRCGACCFSSAPDYLLLLGIDQERLGSDAERLTHWIDGRRYMRLESGHCAALDVQADGQFLCSIYERRPDVCRWLERGSGTCRGDIATKSLLSAAALVQVRAKRGP